MKTPKTEKANKYVGLLCSLIGAGASCCWWLFGVPQEGISIFMNIFACVCGLTAGIFTGYKATEWAQSIFPGRVGAILFGTLGGLVGGVVGFFVGIFLVAYFTVER